MKTQNEIRTFNYFAVVVWGNFFPLLRTVFDNFFCLKSTFIVPVHAAKRNKGRFMKALLALLLKILSSQSSNSQLTVIISVLVTIISAIIAIISE